VAVGRRTGRPRLPTSPPRLSGQEQRVLDYLATRLTNAEIAAAMHLSLATVKTHISHVYLKLSVHSRADAVAAAARRGWAPAACPTCGTPILGSPP